MIFSSLNFLFLFLPVVLTAYYLAPGRLKNAVLLLASLFFYGWGEPVYILLMLLSVGFNYFVGLDIAGSRRGTRLRTYYLVLAVCVNLLLLFFFKYLGFALSILHLKGVQIALPIGISFYTFQALSYVIDVYRGRVSAQKNPLDFALYITMFPQLIAGPIVQYIDMEKQLRTRTMSWSRFGIGAEYFTKGLAKKVLLANQVGELATAIQSIDSADRGMCTAWIGAIAYTLQIYFDFSGYSDMAIGLGHMFGFEFPKNFDYPYLSGSVTEFWRRWHITLGTWFREYVYIPLGGNRVSALRHVFNIMVVWMLTGLWHGASYNFLCWGLYYGILLLLEKRVYGRYLETCPRIVRNLYTMFLVVLGWVLFMSPDLTSALQYMGNLFGSSGVVVDAQSLYYLHSYGLILAAAIVCCTDRVYRLFQRQIRTAPAVAVVINAVLWVVITACLVSDTYNPFLYFRF